MTKGKLFSLPFLPSGCFKKYHRIFNQIMISPMSRTMAFSLLYVMSGGRVGGVGYWMVFHWDFNPTNQTTLGWITIPGDRTS